MGTAQLVPIGFLRTRGVAVQSPEQAKRMGEISDGAIVGSAIIKILEKYGKAAPKYVGEYVKSMKDAMR